MRLTPAVRAVFALEIRSLLRDVRTLLISVGLPVVLLPALFLATTWTEDRRVVREEARTYRFAVAGPDSAFAASLLEGLVLGEDGNGRGARFRSVVAADPLRALQLDSVDVYVEAFTPEAWRSVEEADTATFDVPQEFEGGRVLLVRYHSNRSASRQATDRLREHLTDVREARRDSILAVAGLPVTVRNLAGADTVNVASPEEVEGARLGRFLTVILLGLMLLGGSAVATDTLAGEKERGTLATLLTSAAARTEIVTGKLLAVMAVALVIALVQVLNLWIYLGLGVIDPSRGFAATITAETALVLLVLYLPVVALTAGILLLTSAHARSYKEAQLLLTPVLLGMVLPGLAPLLPDISLRSAIMVVPIANLAVAARDVLLGQVHWPSLTVAWLVTGAAAAWVNARSVQALQDEQLITGDTSQEELLGGPDLFRKRVVRWFAVFWAVKVLLDFNLTFEDIRTAALVSVGIVFLAFPLLVIRQFQLNAREALALRVPRAGVWLAVAVGAPSGLLAANTVFRLMDYVVPVPTELLENFGQLLMPEGVPFWQLLVLLAVVPGVTEELTFRGILLHGLRRRFGPVGLALVVGFVFGFFHFQIFRIPATAFLGVVLTAATLLTGSVFPAIVWHTVNNALALFLGRAGIDLVGASWWWGGASFVGLAVAFWILWLFRTPYPDVGRPGRGAVAARRRTRASVPGSDEGPRAVGSARGG